MRVAELGRLVRAVPALAAFYLLLDGDTEKADKHLARAGAHAADVRAELGVEAP